MTPLNKLNIRGLDRSMTRSLTSGSINHNKLTNISFSEKNDEFGKNRNIVKKLRPISNRKILIKGVKDIHLKTIPVAKNDRKALKNNKLMSKNDDSLVLTSKNKKIEIKGVSKKITLK